MSGTVIVASSDGHQKLLEEAPSTFVTEKLRATMGRTAVRAAEAAEYVGAGTIEFLVDLSGDVLLYRSEYAHPGRTLRNRDD